MNDYDWIVFDSTGTLMTPSPEPALLYHQVAQRAGSGQNLDETRSLLRSAIVRHFFQENVDRETDEAFEWTRWRRIVSDALPDLGSQEFEKTFEELWHCFANAQCWRMFDDVMPTLRRLRLKNYRIAVASNFDARLQLIIREMQIESNFDEILISSQLGWSKPNTDFYHAARRRLGSPDASRVLMIGDTHQGDVIAAKSAGWHARHLVRDRDNALADLTADL